MQVQLTRWGTSLGMRIAKDMATRLGLTDGARVEVQAEGDRIVILTGKRHYRLEDLLTGIRPGEMQDAFDVPDGLPVSGEILTSHAESSTRSGVPCCRWVKRCRRGSWLRSGRSLLRFWGLVDRLSPSHRFAAGPSLSRKAGEGFLG